MNKTATAGLAWYRYPFVWLLIALPASAVVAGLTTFYIAAHTEDGLVIDDYYQRGKEINQDISRDHVAQERKLGAQIFLSEDKRSIRVLLNQPVNAPMLLSLIHPTRSGFDQATKLTAQSPQVLIATLAKPLDLSSWHVELGDTSGEWRLRGTWKIKPDQALNLSPQG